MTDPEARIKRMFLTLTNLQWALKALTHTLAEFRCELHALEQEVRHRPGGGEVTRQVGE
jgi:hypothetical protein